MPYFSLNHPKNDFENDINEAFWTFFNEITNNGVEVFENDKPEQMSNHFRRYGAINQFNNHYHYFRVRKGTVESPGEWTHRYRSQIIAAWLERKFDLDFEVHHIGEFDRTGKYDDTKVIIIYARSKEEVKYIHQQFHTYPINSSKRLRGEIR